MLQPFLVCSLANPRVGQPASQLASFSFWYHHDISRRRLQKCFNTLKVISSASSAWDKDRLEARGYSCNPLRFTEFVEQPSSCLSIQLTDTEKKSVFGTVFRLLFGTKTKRSKELTFCFSESFPALQLCLQILPFLLCQLFERQNKIKTENVILFQDQKVFFIFA